MRLDYAAMAQWTPLACATGGTPPGRQLSCCWPHPPAWRPQQQLLGTWAQAQALYMHRQFPRGAHNCIFAAMVLSCNANFDTTIGNMEILIEQCEAI